MASENPSSMPGPLSCMWFSTWNPFHAPRADLSLQNHGLGRKLQAHTFLITTDSSAGIPKLAPSLRQLAFTACQARAFSQ